MWLTRLVQLKLQQCWRAVGQAGYQLRRGGLDPQFDPSRARPICDLAASFVVRFATPSTPSVVRTRTSGATSSAGRPAAWQVLSLICTRPWLVTWWRDQVMRLISTTVCPSQGDAPGTKANRSAPPRPDTSRRPSCQGLAKPCACNRVCCPASFRSPPIRPRRRLRHVPCQVRTKPPSITARPDHRLPETARTCGGIPATRAIVAAGTVSIAVAPKNRSATNDNPITHKI